MGSADWLPRNFFRRIEVVFPILDGILRDRVATEILGVSLADNTKSRFLSGNGLYHRPKLQKRTRLRRSQNEFMQLAMQNGQTLDARSMARTKFRRVALAKRPF
jgi:polyphosphate kinase